MEGDFEVQNLEVCLKFIMIKDRSEHTMSSSRTKHFAYYIVNQILITQFAQYDTFGGPNVTAICLVSLNRLDWTSSIRTYYHLRDILSFQIRV